MIVIPVLTTPVGLMRSLQDNILHYAVR